MDIINTILSNKLDQDIVNIIITDLWKMRFNIVIEEVNEISHSIYIVPFEAHYIAINDFCLRYMVNGTRGISSWIVTDYGSEHWKIQRFHRKIWKK